MRTCNYNIRRKICKTGFNPKNKETVFRRICPSCLRVRSRILEKQDYSRSASA